MARLTSAPRRSPDIPAQLRLVALRLALVPLARFAEPPLELLDEARLLVERPFADELLRLLDPEPPLLLEPLLLEPVFRLPAVRDELGRDAAALLLRVRRSDDERREPSACRLKRSARSGWVSPPLSSSRCSSSSSSSSPSAPAAARMSSRSE
jgi:hypothetical protein